MQKVLVIGSCGAGKSTFARQFGELTGLPVIHLDKLFWHPNWVETPKEEWREKVASALEGERWIIDGNYGGTMEMRLEKCDTAIFLDLPRAICTYRVIKRVVLYRDGSRPDMGEGCPERFDWDFVKWTWNYPRRSRPSVERRLAKMNGSINVIRLSSSRQVARYLETLKAGYH